MNKEKEIDKWKKAIVEASGLGGKLYARDMIRKLEGLESAQEHKPENKFVKSIKNFIEFMTQYRE